MIPDLTQISISANNCEYLLEECLLPNSDLNINACIVNFERFNYVAYRTDFMDEFDPKNYLSALDKEFNPIWHKPLSLDDGNTAFEDVRLFEYDNQLLALYTYLPKKGDSWKWENGISIGQVDIDNGIIINQQSLRFLANDLHEKNYVPLIFNGTLYVIANFHPHLRAFIVSGNPGQFQFTEMPSMASHTDQWKFGQLRGGTRFIKSSQKNEAWHYSFVHSSLYLPNGNFSSRYYFYTILRINPITFAVEFYPQPIGYSRNFTEGEQDESLLLKSKKNLPIKVVFPMGIINYDNGVLLSYGKDDVISRMKFYSWTYIHSLFDKT